MARKAQTIILGKDEAVYAEFRDINNDLTNVSNPHVDIYDPEGILVDSGTPVNESTGVYYHILSLSTSSSTKQGYYSAWFSGTIGGLTISQDDPRYLLVRQAPTTVGLGGQILDDIRRFVGDDDPTDYHISDVDLHYYLNDGVDYIQEMYDMGYTITVSPTSITFNKDLTNTARELFKRGTAYMIIEGLKHRGLWGAGSINIGDMNINVTNVNRARATAAKELKENISESIHKLLMLANVGADVDTYTDGVAQTIGAYVRRWM